MLSDTNCFPLLVQFFPGKEGDQVAHSGSSPQAASVGRCE